MRVSVQCIVAEVRQDMQHTEVLAKSPWIRGLAETWMAHALQECIHHDLG